MLSREQAQEIIKAATLENHNALLATRISTLESGLAKKTLDYLHMDAQGKPLEWTGEKAYEERRDFIEAARKVFGAITQEEFDAVLQVWFPRFAKVVQKALITEEITWQGFRSGRQPTIPEQINRCQSWRSLTREYDQPLEWFAEHATYMYGNQLTPLFVAAIDQGNTNILEMFIQTCSSEHPVSVMGDHVIQTLMQINNPKGWEAIEKLLLAAQRQEGLRQSIFGRIYSAHPKAIARMLHLILENDLLRFSSSVQWAQGYLPLLPHETTPKVLENALREYTKRFEHPDSSRAVLKNLKASPEFDDFYLAIHTLARVDLEEAATLLLPWFKHSSGDLRFIAMYLFRQFDMKLDIQNQIQQALSDPDDRVAIYAFRQARFANELASERDKHFAFLEQFLKRFSNPIKLSALSTWTSYTEFNPEEIVAVMLSLVAETNPRVMLKYRPQMSAGTESNLLHALTKETPWQSDVRELVMQGLNSKNSQLRDSAIYIINTHQLALEEHELVPLEKLLSRKTADVRRETIELILRQAPSVAAASAARLIALKNPEQKKAGEEILRELEKKDSEETQPKAIDGFGLFNPDLRTPAFAIETKNLVLFSEAAKRSVLSLDALVKIHAQTIVPMETYDGTVIEVVFESYDPRFNNKPSLAEEWKAFALHEIWENWYAERSKDERDTDGLELARAALLIELVSQLPAHYSAYKRNESACKKLKEVQDAWFSPYGVHQEYFGLLSSQTKVILMYLLRIHANEQVFDFALDVLEHQLAIGIPTVQEEYNRLLTSMQNQSQSEGLSADQILLRKNWLDSQLSELRQSNEVIFTTLSFPRNIRPQAQQLREWNLKHTRQLQTPWRNNRPMWELELGLEAWKAGVANQTDIWDWLIGPEAFHLAEKSLCRVAFAEFTSKKPHLLLEKYPKLKPMVDACTKRILELELKRGDLPTTTSAAALKIKYLEGTDILLSILQALGKDSIVRVGNYVYGEQARNAIFSRLIRVVHPAPTDTAQDFANAIKKAGISEQRLLELGLFAPQWIHFVAAAIGWKGLDQAMYWLLAHTKESSWSGNQQELEGWKAEMAQLTPLTTQDLMDGAVDVAWFNKVYKDLGETRWAQLYEAAKYTSSGTGHARAKQFADAMLGKLAEADVQKRILEKRHQDSLRAFGLLPLPKNKDAALLARFETVQTFIKGSKKFGSQKKESEGLAARIGLENLARTAGYSDPMRLEWAMEIKAVADLAKGAVKLKKGDVEFVLSVAEDGEPNFVILKNGKTLKDIPANLKKDEAVLELRARRKELENQRSRMRVSLERAMVHADEFTAKELRDLTKHPIVKPMLEQLVFISEKHMGFLSADGKNLISANGELLELGKTSRLAHPVDLLESGTWSEFQAAFFAAKRQQPFKQIFRELYLLTEAEKLEKTQSSRYAGHQVNQRQSVALLGSRNWVVPYEDDASRTFFAEGITAHVSSKYGWTTPAEVEAPALDTVHFTKRNEWESLDLESIPKRLYSEVMRDLDLVVSVAHVGGVDPEASQSTTEMRAALLLETLRLLKLENVRLEKSVALIQGQIGRYSVHLGSAVVHQQPGGAICLVAVPNQARGRIFLPFADSDPRTAEVIAKVLMLAKDSEIQDPILLRQLVG